MSSDALLMNIFCHPGITKRKELSSILGAGMGDLPESGFKPRIPLTSGFVERTEIDMKLGSVLFEAKLTEADFQDRTPRSSKDIAIWRRSLKSTIYHAEARCTCPLSSYAMCSRRTRLICHFACCLTRGGRI